MNSISINKKSYKLTSYSISRAALVACACIAMAACGSKTNSNGQPQGGDTSGDSTGGTGGGGTVTGGATGGATGGITGGASGSSAITATDSGKTQQLTFATLYQDKSQTETQFGFNLSTYDYCAWSAAHSPALYPRDTFGSLGFYIPGAAGGSAPLKPGTYTVGTEILTKRIGYTGYTEDCKSPWPAGVSGTVTITSVSGNVVKGSVDLVTKANDALGTPGSIKGNFTTTPCTQVGTTPPANDPAACPQNN